nr:membrane-targeted effector domain-containing toxin [Erwinia sp. Ejp617]
MPNITLQIPPQPLLSCAPGDSSEPNAEATLLSNLLKSVTNSTFRYVVNPVLNAGKGVYRSLRERSPLQAYRACEQDIELKAVHTEGEVFRSEAELINDSRRIQNGQQILPLLLRGKVGIALGAALLAGSGLGAGYYFKRSGRDPQEGDYSGHQAATGYPVSNFTDADSGRAAEDSSAIYPFSHDDAVRFSSIEPPAFSSVVPYLNKTTAKESESVPIRGRRHMETPVGVKEANREISWHLYNENYLEELAVNKQDIYFAAAAYLLSVDSDGMSMQEERTGILARIILEADDLYGGRESEPLSAMQATSVVRHWFFSNILDCLPVEIVARRIAFNKYHSDNKPKSIKENFSLPSLYKHNYVSENGSDKRYLDAFNQIWLSILNEDMPFLRFADYSDKDPLLYSDKFASLYAGARFLDDIKQPNITLEDAVKAGDRIWDLAADGNLTEDQIGYLRVPTLFYMAKHSPKNVRYVMNLRDITPAEVDEYIQIRKKNAIRPTYQKYYDAIKSWLPKRKLADSIISQCPPGSAVLADNWGFGSLSPKQNREKLRQHYMTGAATPCKGAPASLSDKYRELTNNVANSFLELDKYLIYSALKNLPRVEYTFITAPDAIMRPVKFSMKTHKGTWATYGVATPTVTYLSLKKIDLVSVSQGNAERIYALIRISAGMTGYNIIRVDHDIRNYIDSGIIDYNFFGKDYEFSDHTVRSNGNEFHYTIKADDNIVTARDGDIQLLIKFLSLIHRDDLYDSLYKVGNDPSDFEKVWKVVKVGIPFYDCLEGIISHDPMQAVPSCMMDAAQLVPGIGRAAGLGGRFAMKLAVGVRHGVASLAKGGGVRVAAKSTLNYVSLPSMAEMALLGRTTLRSIDPGFELLTTVSRSFCKKVKTLLASDSQTADLASKIMPPGINDIKSVASSDESVIALISDAEIRLPLKRVGDENGRKVYVRFNPETGDAFGLHYLLDDGYFHPGVIKNAAANLYPANKLQYVLNDVPALSSESLIHATPDDNGLYTYTDPLTKQKIQALKVNNQFYRLYPGREKWLWHVGDENGVEVARFDHLFYKINYANRLDLKYKPCRAGRSPGGRCVHLSPRLETIFKENKRYGVPESENASIKPAKSHPGLFANPDGKLYIKYEDVFFRLKNEHPNHSDEILSVIGPKSGGVFGKLIKKRIAEVTTSRDGGGYYFNTPEENMMECAGTSQALAQLHSAMRRLSFMEYRNFLMPAEMRETVLRMDKKILNNRDYYANDLTPEEENIVSVFRKQTDEMLAEAGKFFQKGVSYINKCHIPAIALTDKPEDIFSKIYERNNGVAIGEDHSSIASKKFIIDNIDVLYKNGVRTLYIEHLQTDMHQADLDSYFQTGEMSLSLKEFINDMDVMGWTDLLGIYNFMTLIQTAQKRKIRITAIDSFVSYNGFSPGSGNTDRVALMNYYSHLLINKNQLHRQNKWIALVGSAHTNTFEGVPGLADLNGIVSIRVNDLPAGEAGGIFKDPGEVYHCFRASRARIAQADFLLEMGVTDMRRVAAPPSAESLLHIPGQFVIKRRGNKNVLIYMNRESNLLQYPIETTTDNHFYLNTNEPRWDIVSRERFERLDEMVRFIQSNRGMKLVA